MGVICIMASGDFRISPRTCPIFGSEMRASPILYFQFSGHVFETHCIVLRSTFDSDTALPAPKTNQVANTTMQLQHLRSIKEVNSKFSLCCLLIFFVLRLEPGKR